MAAASATFPAKRGQSRGPNYSKIHAQLLPLDTFPLPPLIPHNPFSLLQIAFVYISHLLAPPSSHPQKNVSGYFSPETRSVHITDEISVRHLWECGFFGKGTLSRSEPTWLDREKRKRGLLANQTSEEATKQRREARKKFKEERARKERQAIETQLFEERLSTIGASNGKPTARSKYENAISTNTNCEVEPTASIPNDQTIPTLYSSFSIGTSDPSEVFASVNATGVELPQTEAKIQNQEHLQLTLEEAFFLTYALGILDIYLQPMIDLSTPTENAKPINAPAALSLFRSHSHFPPVLFSDLSSSDPFFLSYATYHHFRSLGWVVRPGIKFAVDWLLYLRGPAFSHAEFAVIVIPAYRDPWWRETEERRKVVTRAERRGWDWLHCLQRIQAHVRKSLIVTWVEIPGEAAVQDALGNDNHELDVGALLRLYKVREVIMKRWIPNRSRD